jgi:hypothetical protein
MSGFLKLGDVTSSILRLGGRRPAEGQAPTVHANAFDPFRS